MNLRDLIGKNGSSITESILQSLTGLYGTLKTENLEMPESLKKDYYNGDKNLRISDHLGGGFGVKYERYLEDKPDFSGYMKWVKKREKRINWKKFRYKR